jgi:hypothetical protein
VLSEKHFTGELIKNDGFLIIDTHDHDKAKRTIKGDQLLKILDQTKLFTEQKIESGANVFGSEKHNQKLSEKREDVWGNVASSATGETKHAQYLKNTFGIEMTDKGTKIKNVDPGKTSPQFIELANKMVAPGEKLLKGSASLSEKNISDFIDKNLGGKQISETDKDALIKYGMSFVKGRGTEVFQKIKSDTNSVKQAKSFCAEVEKQLKADPNLLEKNEPLKLTYMSFQKQIPNLEKNLYDQQNITNPDVLTLIAKR